MKIRIFTLALLISGVVSLLNAQIAMGKWRTHFAYNVVNQITQSENKVFAVSEGALFSVDKEDQGVEFYSKLSGLSDSNISGIEYDAENKQLLIVYLNGNIDFLSTGGVINIPDLYNKQMSSSKAVNHIAFYNGKAYLSCSFGILVLNMDRREVADTYFIGPNGTDINVLNTTINNSHIYALTTNTIYKGLANEPNLVNYEYWSTMSGLPGSGDMKKLLSFEGKLILLRGDKLYSQDENNVWTPFLSQISVSNFYISNGKMMIYDGDSSVYIVNESLNVSLVENIGEIPDAEYDTERGLCWFAGKAKGVLSYNTATTAIETYKPMGPATNVPWDMKFAGQKLFVVQGGRWAAEFGKPGYVMMYENGEWLNLDPKDIKAITQNEVLDFVNVAVDPDDNKHFFVTSYGTGLYEFKNNKFEDINSWYNNLNSSLETILQNAPFRYIRLDGAVFDSNKNLFMTNSYVSGGIQIRLADGTWTKLTNPEFFKPTLGKIHISQQNPNQKWIPSVRYSPGYIVLDDNGTLENQNDDKVVFRSSFVYIETDNGQTNYISVNPTSVNTIVEDLNGVIWIGTELGPFLFYNTSKVFDSDYTCSRVKISREDGTGLADYLLEKENIKAIAIDGANRKWIGTQTSGVYLMSENGQETIHQFTVSNSPLLSNDILSIAINPESGEVFFGTGNGIVSYQSDAVNGSETFNDVHAYPNPVREGFTGIITITGLVKDTQVKITDLNGNLICQTVSNGGIATWDGKDVHGKKVSTGVYLAICANEDGTQSTITKIMVIN